MPAARIAAGRIVCGLDNSVAETILMVSALRPTKGGPMSGCGCGKKPAAPAKKSSKPTDKKK
ncbi:MAG: hypothetical protein PHU43_01865 [Candidatus Bipolaricaulis sp.]|nr:hypothetical protein [Candidatus Bipolaricaulis sp.]